jgi:hypothetical protein
MPLVARQILLVTSTATPLIVKGSGSGTTFKNTDGTLQDPIPVIVKNEDTVITVWIGGSDVDATHGQSLAPGQTLPINMYGSDVPYAFAVGTPIVSVLVGRQ